MREPATTTLLHRYRAGMPQLAYRGLSENWLFKECGHRHWEALAAATGRTLPEFVDDRGERAYVAFTAVRISDALLDTVAEHDEFEIETVLTRCGAGRHLSVHRLRCRGAVRARITLASALLRRREAGSNQSVVRARFAALDGPLDTTPGDAALFARIGKALRAGTWSAELGDELPPSTAGQAGASEFLPCPNGDFNGAGFLYCANFQAFVDRAEWQRLRCSEPPVLAARHLFYHGNLDVGDTLVVTPRAEQVNANGFVHWCEVLRGSDRAKIADVVTAKRWRRA